MIRSSGLNHIDLATKDMEATRHFYEDVLGFPLVRADLVEIVGQGTMKHYFFGIGNGESLPRAIEVEAHHAVYDETHRRSLQGEAHVGQPGVEGVHPVRFAIALEDAMGHDTSEQGCRLAPGLVLLD
jgi:catechol 2,3-dioxygenase-like lactoylglutathione lyase family enzyme